MASLAKRADRGDRWQATYKCNGCDRHPLRGEHAKLFDKKVDAEKWLAANRTAVDNGTWIDPKAAKVTVRDYAKSWEAAQVGRDATARVIDNALRLHILPHLGDMPIGTVRRSHMQAVVKVLSEKRSAATVALVYGVASRMFSAAVDDRMIPVSPCRRVALPRATSAEVVPPTVEEVVLLAAKADKRYRAAVVLLAGSGLRIGELLGLRVADVDFLRRTVRVERQRTQKNAIAPPKTATSVRTVPLAKVVVDELAAHLAAYPSGEWLFTEPSGEPVTYRRWRMIWDATREKAKLEVGTHDLRHFFASALIAGGASVKQVQTTLGHANASITLETYSHLWPGDDDRTRNVIDATLAVLGSNDVVTDAAVTGVVDG